MRYKQKNVMAHSDKQVRGPLERNGQVKSSKLRRTDSSTETRITSMQTNKVQQKKTKTKNETAYESPRAMCRAQ